MAQDFSGPVTSLFVFRDAKRDRFSSGGQLHRGLIIQAANHCMFSLYPGPYDRAYPVPYPQTDPSSSPRFSSTQSSWRTSRQRSSFPQSDLVGEDFTEKAIALDLARDVALKTATPFPAMGEGAAGLYDED